MAILSKINRWLDAYPYEIARLLVTRHLSLVTFTLGSIFIRFYL